MVNEVDILSLYERVIDDFAHAVVATDVEGVIRLWNTEAERLYGWTADEAVGELFVQLTSPTAPPVGIPMAPTSLQRSERWAQRRDGSVVLVRERHSEPRDHSGAVVCRLIEAEDVSDRWSLRRQLAVGFDSAPHGWAFVDLEGRFTMVNDAMAKILGRNASEIVGHSPTSFTAPEDQAMATPIVAMTTGAQDHFQARKRVVRPDGTRRWVDVDVRLVSDHDGRPQYIFGHVVDVTDAVKSEASYQELFHSVVNSFAASHELSDPFTAGHQQRVARLAAAIGGRIGLDEDAREGVAIGAVLHDIGKVATPAQLLTKPGRLDPLEFELIKRHARAGHDIIAHIDFPWPIAEIVLQHHERLDGSGYPHGLDGDDILIESRIVAVADTIEVISSHRPYKAARPIQVALETVAASQGQLFDTDVVDACLALFAEGYELD